MTDHPTHITLPEGTIDAIASAMVDTAKDHGLIMAIVATPETLAKMTGPETEDRCIEAWRAMARVAMAETLARMPRA